MLENRNFSWVGDLSLRLKSGSGRDDANPEQFWISDWGTTAGTGPVAKHKERVGHFIFHSGYCVGGKNWIFFGKTIHGPSGSMGE